MTNHHRLATLQPSPKLPGTRRACTPEQTVQRVETGLARLGLKARTVPGPTRWRLRQQVPFVRLDLGLPDDPEVVLCETTGKGTDPVAARASACAEVVERLVSRDNFTFQEGAAHLRYYKHLYDAGELPREPLADQAPDGCVGMRYFLDGFEQLFRDTPLVEQLRQVPMLWREAYSLTGRRPVRYPTIWQRLRSTTTGLSAGNTHEEAILHGLCEILERFAITAVVADRISAPALALGEVRDPALRELLERFAAEQIDVRAFDFSLGLGVPVVGALISDRRFRLADHPLFGRLDPMLIAACRPDPEQALLHCLSEYTEDIHPMDDDEEAEFLRNWELRTRRLGVEGRPLPADIGLNGNHTGGFTLVGYDFSFLRGATSAGLPRLRDGDTRVELERFVEALDRAGHEVLVDDLTHPRLDLPVVRVVVPGLGCCGYPSALGPADTLTRLLLVEHQLGLSGPLHARVVERHDALVPPRLTGPAYAEALDNLFFIHARATGSWRRDPRALQRLIAILERPVASWGFAHNSEHEPIMTLAFLHQRRGELERALEHLEVLAELFPDQPEALAARAIFERRLGRPVRGLEALDPDFDLDGFEQELDVQAESYDPFTPCDLDCAACPADERAECVWGRIDVGTLRPHAT
jgi:YcaO-like protein with predicted kinase domain